MSSLVEKPSQNSMPPKVTIVREAQRVVVSGRERALLKQAEYMEAQSNRLANMARELRQMLLKSE